MEKKFKPTEEQLKAWKIEGRRIADEWSPPDSWGTRELVLDITLISSSLPNHIKGPEVQCCLVDTRKDLWKAWLGDKPGSIIWGGVVEGEGSQNALVNLARSWRACAYAKMLECQAEVSFLESQHRQEAKPVIELRNRLEERLTLRRTPRNQDV